jgi:hypothetical protein
LFVGVAPRSEWPDSLWIHYPKCSPTHFFVEINA